MSTRLETRACAVAGGRFSAVASQMVGDLLAAGAAAVRRARNGHRRRQAEHALFTLSDTALKDIGIHRSGIRRIAAELLAGGIARRNATP